jgi:hypothetical protein
LTGTPFAVNTANPPLLSRASLICLGCSRFKQTFVLDAASGVDIMPPLERTARHPLRLQAAAEGLMDEVPNLQLEKYR